MQMAVFPRLPGDGVRLGKAAPGGSSRLWTWPWERGGAGGAERPLAEAVLAGVSAGMVRSHPVGGGAG
jgi:hypothetical protein